MGAAVVDIVKILRETQHTPVSHTPDIPKPSNERNSFINCWLGVWGMLQGSVGKFLEKCMRSSHMCVAYFTIFSYLYTSWKMTATRELGITAESSCSQQEWHGFRSVICAEAHRLANPMALPRERQPSHQEWPSCLWPHPRSPLDQKVRLLDALAATPSMKLYSINQVFLERLLAEKNQR